MNIKNEKIIEENLKYLDKTAMDFLEVIFENRWLHLDYFEEEEKFFFEMIFQLSLLKTKEERLSVIEKSNISYFKERLEEYYEKNEI